MCFKKKEQINYLKTRANAKDLDVRADTHMYVNTFVLHVHIVSTCVHDSSPHFASRGIDMCLYVGLPAMWVARVTVAIKLKNAGCQMQHCRTLHVWV